MRSMPIIVISVSVFSGPLAAQQFVDLGPNTRIFDLNHDGSRAVGDATAIAFRWSQAGGIVPLGTLPGDTTSIAEGISPDGSVVAGTSSLGNARRSFRWTEAGGFEVLGPVPVNGPGSWGRGVSDDGAVVWVVSAISFVRSYLWTASSGFQQVVLSQGWDNNFPAGMSGDGAVVVGSSWIGAWHIWRWSGSTGMQELQSNIALKI